MPLANTASAAGCPLACGGRPVKPFTPMGDGMLGTAGAVMPGGVLPPGFGEAEGLREKEGKGAEVRKVEHGVLLCYFSGLWDSLGPHTTTLSCW